MSNVMSVPNGSSLNLTVLKHFETTLEIQTALECLKVAAQLKNWLNVISILSNFRSRIPNMVLALRGVSL